MKSRLLLLSFLAVLGIGAATYTITQLTENATPGAGTIIEIYDPTHNPKSGKITLDSAGFREAAGLAIGTDVQPYDVDLSTLAAGKTGLVLGYGNGLFYDAVTPIAPGVLICPTGLNAYEFTTDLHLDTLTVTNQLRLLSTELVQAVTNVVISLAMNSPARRYIVATNDLNFTATDPIDGASVDIGIYAGDTNRNLTFPATWTWFGSPAPSVLASNKFARFTVQYWSGLTNYHCFYSPSF